jgi:hypothetical protein
MLLHVIEAAGPVDSSSDTIGQEGGVEQVGYPVALIYNVCNPHTSQLTGIERLATRGGIKSRLVEIHTPAILGPIGHRGLEITGVRIGIIESVCHREPGPSH